MALTKISTGMLKADAASVDLNIDAGTLFLDVANNRIGIANTSPADALHIGGAGHLLFERGGELRSKDTSGNVKTIARVDGSNRLQYGWSGAGGVLFMGGGSYTERMRIHTNGNVGIGITNPGSLLTVEGDIRQTTGDLLYTGGGNWNLRHLIDNQNITFDTSASGTTSEKMRVRADGNVGIGTTNPTYKLHVAGTSYFSGGIQIDSADKITIGNPNQFITAVNDTSLTLATDGSASLTILDNGNVGIGATSPSTTLEVVAGNIRLRDASSGTYFQAIDTDGSHNAGYFMRSGSNNWYTLVDTTGRYQIYDGDAVAIRVLVDGSGNVGIAKTNPGTKLDVAGDIRALEAIYSEGSAPRVQLQDTDGTNQFSFFQQSSSQLSLRLRNDSADGSFRIAGYGGTTTTDRMIIGSTGDFSFYQDDGTTRMVHMDASSGRSMVGSIGTNVAIGRFHIVGNSDVNDEDCQLVITDVDGSSGSRIPSIRFTGYHNGSFLDQGRIRGTDTQGVVISGSSAFGNDLVVQSTGVGVGTNSPTSKADIRGPHGATHSRGQLYLSNTESHAVNQGSQISLGGTYAGTNDTYFASIAGRKENATSGNYAGYLQFGTRGDGTNNAERMRITSTGNVGIGTSSPPQKLSVRGTILKTRSDNDTGLIYLQNDGSNNGNIVINQNGGVTRIKLDSAGDSYFNGGDLGIGTTSPARRLEVDFTSSTIGMRLTRGDNAGSSLMEFANTGGVTNIIGHDAGRGGFIIGPSATPSVTIKNSTGNVGIGTDAPAAILHVVGPAARPTDLASVDTASTAQFQADASNAHSLYIAENASGALIQVNDGATNSTTAKPLALQAFGGNVGIGTGTTAPSAILETVSPTTGGAPIFRAGTADFMGVQVGTQGVGFSVETNNYFSLWHQPYADRGTQTNLTERLRMLSSGRIGIGHTAPNANLHINAGNNTAVSIGDTTNPAFQIGGTTNYRFGVYTDGETAYIENKNGDDGIAFRVKTAGEAMRVDGLTGNVGIGTNNPQASLHLNTASDTYFILGTTNATADGRIQFRNSAGNDVGGLWYNTSGNRMIFRTNSEERMRIDSSGRVSIGTQSNSNSALTVQGDGTTNTTFAFRADNSSGNHILEARDDGVVLIDTNYLYVNNNGGFYSNGAIRARGGITNDGGNTLSISSGSANINFNSKNFTNVGTITSTGASSFGSVTFSSGLIVGSYSSLGYQVGLGTNSIDLKRDGTSYINQQGTGTIAFRFGSSYTTGLTLSSSSATFAGTISAGGNIDLGTATDGSRRFRWYNDNYHALYYDNDLLGSQSADVITYYQNFVFRHQDTSNKVTIDSTGTLTTAGKIHATSNSGSQAAYNLGWQNSARALEMRYDSSYYMGIEMHAETRDLIFNNKSGDNAGDIRFYTGSTLTEKLTILANGNVGIGEGGSPDRKLHVGGSIKVGDDNAYEDTGDNFNGGVVFQTPIYTEYQWKWNGADDHETNLYCGSYFMAEIIFTQHQTNGGSDINRHFVGKWANNHTTHVLETVHDSGSTWSMTTSMTATDHNLNASGSANGRLRIVETYGSGSFSFSTLTVRVYQGSLSNVTHTYG